MILDYFHFNFLELFFLLAALHFVADYPMQGDYMAQAKNKYLPQGKGIWMWVLLAHAMIHGAAVFVSTLMIGIALIEVITHATIDHLKNSGKLGSGSKGYMVDQSLHVGLKFLYVVVIFTLHYFALLDVGHEH